MGLLNNWQKIQELPFHITHMKTQQEAMGDVQKGALSKAAGALARGAYVST